MLKLNLVSEELKKEIELRHVFDIVKRVIFVFVVLAIFVSVVFAVTHLTLKFYSTPIMFDQGASLNGRYQEEVKQINKKIDVVSSIQSEQLDFTALLNEVLSYAEDGVTFKIIKIETETNKLNISGNADTRDNLLALQKNLEESSLFSEVQLPAINIFKKEDINFNVEAVILK